LEQLLVLFSLLVVEQRWIKEIDINPLLISPDKMVALDARIVVHEANVRLESIPELAIRPYPAHYATSWTMPDGIQVTIRPIRPEDEPSCLETLSERSVYLRYFRHGHLSGLP
jgi:acetyltransferase